MVKCDIAVLIGCSSQFLIALAYRNSILGTLRRLTQNWLLQPIKNIMSYFPSNLQAILFFQYTENNFAASK